MRHPSRLGLALAVIAFCLGQIHAAKYGEACSNDADCTDEGAPYCFVYFQDLSPIGQEAVPVSTGKCVECREDCNCGINRYCGIPDSDDGDYLTYDGGFTSSNAGFGKWSETNVNKVAALKEAFSGMPMPSKCMKYKEGDDQDKFCIMHNDFSNQGFYIARTYTRDDDDVTQQGTVTAAAQSWPEALKDRYCGKIDSWVPNFRGFKSFNTVGSSGTTSDTDIDPTNAKTDHELLGTGSPSSPGRCAKKVYYDECVYAVAAKTALNDKCVGAAQTTGTLSFTNCPTGVSHYPTFDNLGSDGMTCVVLETNAAGDTMGTYREDHPEDRATIKAKLDLCYQITTPCSKSRMDLDTTLGGDLQMGWSQDMCSNSGMWQAKVNEVYYMNIWSPATAWTGSCERTKCKVCRNADTMCQDPKRTCVNNQWTEAFDGDMYRAWSAHQNNDRFILQTTITVLLAVLIGVAFGSAVLGSSNSEDHSPEFGVATGQVAYTKEVEAAQAQSTPEPYSAPEPPVDRPPAHNPLESGVYAGGLDPETGEEEPEMGVA